MEMGKVPFMVVLVSAMGLGSIVVHILIKGWSWPSDLSETLSGSFLGLTLFTILLALRIVIPDRDESGAIEYKTLLIGFSVLTLATGIFSCLVAWRDWKRYGQK